MFGCQVSDCVQVASHGQGQTVQRSNVSEIKFTVRLQHEVLIFEHPQFNFLFLVKNVEDPVKAGHVHHINEVGLDYGVVDLWSFGKDVLCLLCIFAYQIFGGRIDESCLDLTDLLSHLAPVFPVDVVVEELLGALKRVANE